MSGAAQRSAIEPIAKDTRIPVRSVTYYVTLLWRLASVRISTPTE